MPGQFVRNRSGGTAEPGETTRDLVGNLGNRLARRPDVDSATPIAHPLDIVARVVEGFGDIVTGNPKIPEAVIFKIEQRSKLDTVTPCLRRLGNPAHEGCEGTSRRSGTGRPLAKQRESHNLSPMFGRRRGIPLGLGVSMQRRWVENALLLSITPTNRFHRVNQFQ